MRNWFYTQNIPVGYFAYTHAYIRAYTRNIRRIYNSVYPILCTVCTSSLVKRMFLYPVRYRLGMMLRTYRERAKVVTSFELQNTPIGGGQKLLYD